MGMGIRVPSPSMRGIRHAVDILIRRVWHTPRMAYAGYVHTHTPYAYEHTHTRHHTGRIPPYDRRTERIRDGIRLGIRGVSTYAYDIMPILFLLEGPLGS